MAEDSIRPTLDREFSTHQKLLVENTFVPRSCDTFSSSRCRLIASGNYLGCPTDEDLMSFAGEACFTLQPRKFRETPSPSFEQLLAIRDRYSAERVPDN